MNMNYQQLTELQLQQLERLLETKKVGFRTAYYIIFSDVPTKGSLASILSEAGVEMNNDLRLRLEKERMKL